MLPDLTLETIAFLQDLNTPEAEALADKNRRADWRLVPTCQNCRHCSLTSSWCKQFNHNTKPSKQLKCFQGTPDYLELTKPLKPLS